MLDGGERGQLRAPTGLALLVYEPTVHWIGCGVGPRAFGGWLEEVDSIPLPSWSLTEVK